MRNGERIAKVPFPLTNTSTKLSGLSVNTDYVIQLLLHTSAGLFASQTVSVKTHTIDDVSGIRVCIGNIPDKELAAATQKVIEDLGAQCTEGVQIDTTHLLCTQPPSTKDDGLKKAYETALSLSLPIVQPHWLFACQSEKRYVQYH